MSNNEKQTSDDVKPEREVIEASPVEPEPAEGSPVADEAAGDAHAAAAEPAAGMPPPAPRGGVAALVIAILAVLLSSGLGGLGYYRSQQLDQQIGALAPAIERNAGRIAAAEQRVDELRVALDGQQAAAERLGRGLQEAIDAVRAQLGRDQSGWVLAETEYLMLIANHRLQLERDVPTAVAALQIADTRLRDTGDPALIVVREKLAAEITALNTVPRPDLTGLALRLMGLAEQVARLPLKSTYQPPAPAAAPDTAPVDEGPGWQKLAGGVWNDLKGLVTVRRTEEAVRPMLAPEQQYFLRQNLRLQLAAARLALLRADAEQLRLALQTARAWIGDHFDARSGVTAGMLEELDAIAAVEVRPELPDVSGSLNALRTLLRQAARQE